MACSNCDSVNVAREAIPVIGDPSTNAIALYTLAEPFITPWRRREEGGTPTTVALYQFIAGPTHAGLNRPSDLALAISWPEPIAHCELLQPLAHAPQIYPSGLVIFVTLDQIPGCPCP